MSVTDEKEINIKKESQNEIALNKSIRQEKYLEELFRKLMQESLSKSLEYLENKNKEENITINILMKDSTEYQSKLSKLSTEVEENIKKKDTKNEKSKNKEKDNFKNKKTISNTQSNFRPRNEKHLLENKTKKLNKNKEKDILNKTTTRFNTLNNSKILEEKPQNNKMQNIANKTQYNFRNNKKTTPSTPTKKKEKTIEINKNKINKIDKKEKEEKFKTITNKVNDIKPKKINTHINNKYISKSFSTKPMNKDSEKKDKKGQGEKKEINPIKAKIQNVKKDIKKALFKNIKKEFNKLDNKLNVIEEKKEMNKTITNDEDKKDDKKNKGKKDINLPPDKKFIEQEETIKKQKEKITQLSEELKNYKKDNRKGIYIIKQDKSVHISKDLITIKDEFVILIKCEPLQYYYSTYYYTECEIDKLKSKQIYIDNKKLEDKEYEINDKYSVKIHFKNTYNDETRKIKIIQEIPNNLLNYSYYDLSFNKIDTLLKYEITVDNDIQIDDVTNEYFKLNNNWAYFEGKTTNEIIVKPGSVIYSKKINYQIYKYIPEYKSKEYEIIKTKETNNNNIGINILAKYVKVVITNYGQEIEELYNIKISNYPSTNYNKNFYHGLLLDTKHEIELVELNGEKTEYLDEKSSIQIINFGAFKNQFAEFHFKYKYFNNEENSLTRTETFIISEIKNSYCKLIISIPDEYIVLQTNDIFPINKENKNEYIFNGISKEDKLKEFFKLSVKKGEWDIQKEITLEGKKNIEKCSFKTDRIFKGGNLEIESYEIVKENAEFVEDLEENKFIFNYNDLNTNKVQIQWNIKAKNSTSNYIFDEKNDLLIKIPKEDEAFFKEISDKILEEDKSDFPIYKKLGKWVFNNMTYNLAYLGRKMTARQILDKKMGVCEHYSLLYNTLLTSQGIKVVKVSGYALDDNNNRTEDKNNINIQNNQNDLSDKRHAWSLALIDGNWVPLDATWNLFEKNVPVTHIFNNYGDSVNNTTSYNENTITSETTKEIIKQIKNN